MPDDVNEDLVRDLYLFFELYCQRCNAVWEPPDPNRDFGVQGQAWAESFSAYFASVARKEGWGSLEGNVLCPLCLAERG